MTPSPPRLQKLMTFGGDEKSHNSSMELIHTFDDEANNIAVSSCGSLFVTVKKRCNQLTLWSAENMERAVMTYNSGACAMCCVCFVRRGGVDTILLVMARRAYRPESRQCVELNVDGSIRRWIAVDWTAAGLPCGIAYNRGVVGFICRESAFSPFSAIDNESGSVKYVSPRSTLLGELPRSIRASFRDDTCFIISHASHDCCVSHFSIDAGKFMGSSMHSQSVGSFDALECPLGDLFVVRNNLVCEVTTAGERIAHHRLVNARLHWCIPALAYSARWDAVLVKYDHVLCVIRLRSFRFAWLSATITAL